MESAGEVEVDSSLTMESAGEVEVDSSLTMESAGEVEVDSSLTMESAVEVEVDSSLTMESAGEVEVDSSLTMESAGEVEVDSSLTMESAGEVEVDSSLTMESAGEVEVDSSLTMESAGEVEVDSSLTMESAGEVEVDSSLTMESTGEVVEEIIRNLETSGGHSKSSTPEEGFDTKICEKEREFIFQRRENELNFRDRREIILNKAQENEWNSKDGDRKGGMQSSKKDFQFGVSSKVNRGFAPNKERIYPVGVKVMQDLLERESYIISVELLKTNSGYHLLLEEPYLNEIRISLILRLIAKSLTSRSNLSGLLDLLLLTFRNTNYIQNLVNFVSDIKYESSKACEYLSLICEIMEHFLRIAPLVAFSIVSNITDLCKGVIEHLQLEKKPEADRLGQAFEDINLQIRRSRNEWKSRVTKRYSSNYVQPPDDFRDHRALPTCAELNDTNVPFIRPLITIGSYENSEHYLDTQFRLLKEDFVRPLREGLHKYRSGDKTGLDIKIYSNIKLCTVSFHKNEITHFLQLSLRKNFDIENSKRLMFGNILCISDDGFETMVIASVSSRDYLRKKVVGMKIETEPHKLEFQKEYTCIESKAYFVSYKYTLEALQELDEVPFLDYIVNVNESESPPAYLENLNATDTIIGHSGFKFSFSQSIDYWPSSNDLGMDESQRRALHGALTRRVAIIQGPPGTGKTFLGLYITKLLLQNGSLWRKGTSHPIVVMCYTNHALDQFLEGMTSFTEKLIRVGSRSKNEALQKYQIKYCIPRPRHYSKYYEDECAVGRAWCECRKELSKTKACIDNIKSVLRCINMPGIIDLDSFIQGSSNIIPFYLFLELKSTTMSHFLVRSFLDDPNLSYILKECRRQFNSSAPRDEEKRAMDIDEVAFDINENLKREEEFDRILDKEDEEEDGYFDCYLQEHTFYFNFELTREDLQERKSSLQSTIDNIQESKPKSWQLHSEIRMLDLELEILMNCQNICSTEEECAKLENVGNIQDLDFHERWKLYVYWKRKLRLYYEKLRETCEDQCMKLHNHLTNLKDIMYLNAMKKADIVGMTTTGAARHCRILHDLAPAIVIVEEAAELMEAHLLSALSTSCQHLIMIGDHQQLRPKPNVYELGLKYNLNISLFERLINNGIKYQVLEYQHRMKPLFSSLLVPTIYEELKDHPSVLNYPQIRGVGKELFFVNHTHLETAPFDESGTFENLHEAQFLMGLCRHLRFQGYGNNDVTIITPYYGQYRCLKMLQNESAFQDCVSVRISILDNYQGEESNIILLSLVRSNLQEKVGFLKTDNRICVALSRAKHGMYIIGNMNQMIKSSPVWRKINQKLIDEENIGPYLPLVCQNHPEEPIMVSSLQDIQRKSPEGGCTRKCESSLPKCTHNCSRMCHVDNSDHYLFQCNRPCQKMCKRGHQCRQKCYKNCAPCIVLVETNLSCSHIHQISCCVDSENFECPTKVDIELPNCKHVVSLECHINIESYLCPKDCSTELKCGHKCSRKCHATDDPDHKNYCCRPCERANLNCQSGHTCLKKCYENCGLCEYPISWDLSCGHTAENVKCGYPKDKIQCVENCSIIHPCNHKCQQKCGVPCGECKVVVKKINPECRHIVEVPCSDEPSLELCFEKCVSRLDCGHYCKEKCNQPCTSVCVEKILSKIKCTQGHVLYLPCHCVQEMDMEKDMIRTQIIDKRNSLYGFCTDECGAKLDCGHACKGKCGQCMSSHVHMPCQEVCNKPLICGHKCKANCNADCPPCQEPCLQKCHHNTCTKLCGITCERCKRKCQRCCRHSVCTANCSNKCNREPCFLPCPRRKKCSHPCIGFCGEPCPALCRICDKKKVAEIIARDGGSDKSRFIRLDCNHIFEAMALDHYVRTSAVNSEEGVSKCPQCCTPIYNTPRYRSLLWHIYEKVFEERQRQYEKKKETNRKLENYSKEIESYWPSEAVTLRREINKCRPFSNAVREPQFSRCVSKVEFMRAAAVMKAKLVNHPKQLAHLIPLVKKVMIHTGVISSQMMGELSRELRRLEVLAIIERAHERNRILTATKREEALALLHKFESFMSLNSKIDKTVEEKIQEFLETLERIVGVKLELPTRYTIRPATPAFKSRGHGYPRGRPYRRVNPSSNWKIQ